MFIVRCEGLSTNASCLVDRPIAKLLLFALLDIERSRSPSLSISSSSSSAQAFLRSLEPFCDCWTVACHIRNALDRRKQQCRQDPVALITSGRLRHVRVCWWSKWRLEKVVGPEKAEHWIQNGLPWKPDSITGSCDQKFIE